MKEIWKSIKSYEGLYELSNYGYVKSLKRKWVLNDIILKAGLDINGYFYVILCKSGKVKAHKISLFVWDHFGDRPRNGRKLQVDHIDNNRQNDRIDNLQLLTNRQNISKGISQNGKTLNKYIGITWHNQSKKWYARIEINGKQKHLGSFNNEVEASSEYQRALKEFIKTGEITINTPMMKKKALKPKKIESYKMLHMLR